MNKVRIIGRPVAFVVAILLFVSFSHAQKVNLVGTTWVLTYTTGRANSKDYQEYSRVSFQSGGRCRFDTGEIGTWTMKGSKLYVKTSSDDGVHYIDARISGNTASGTSVLGMNSQVPYWVRLRKVR